jgi:hypothetical protein
VQQLFVFIDRFYIDGREKSDYENAAAPSSCCQTAEDRIPMLVRTKRFEIEITRTSLFFRAAVFGRTFETFRDLSGQGLSQTSWE